MGSHRAEPRGPHRRSSQERSGSSLGSTRSGSKGYAGRRVAGRPVASAAPVVQPTARVQAPAAPAAVGHPSYSPASPRALRPDATTQFDAEVTAQLPLVRATEPGKRRAAPAERQRLGLVRGLPSAPVLVGLAALAIATGGALTASHSIAPATDLTHVSATTAYGSDAGVSSTFGGLFSARDAQVSRDYVRDVQIKAADAQAVQQAEGVAAERNAALAALAKKATGQAQKIALNQWGLPVEPGVYHLTARFGEYGLWSSFHTGLDFAAPTGTPIHAIANGVVTSAQYDGAYGNKTVVTLPDGTELWYCHQNAFGTTVGATVTEGQIIGYVGSTGHVTGPHVHIEVRPDAGDPVDPFPEFVAHGVTP